MDTIELIVWRNASLDTHHFLINPVTMPYEEERYYRRWLPLNSKSEINFEEWKAFLADLCQEKQLDQEKTEQAMINCGIPGQNPVKVPSYKDFFDTYKPKDKGLTYCNATYDSFLCWPPTQAGAEAFQNCPEARLSDTSRLAFRRCGFNGLWLGRKKNESSLMGWTNYTPCFPTEVQNLFGKVYDDKADPQTMFQIALNTRYMEIVGFSLSLIALLISLYIFGHFRTLRNSRTKVHLNLFLAMVVQVVVRLVLYLDQAFIREGSDPKEVRGLERIPYLCEASYILLEYAISAMFCWMFIEGLHLHSIVTANVLRERITYYQYCLAGWGVPVILTVIWASLTAMHYYNGNVLQCWYGYNFLSQYWVCQAPRLCMVLTNLMFLLNILRVLIIKLNQSQDSELEKIRKAVRAALVLLPLLGITNILNMIEAPLDGSVWKFGLWSYTTHFLRSFQGFFIALIYCFLNGEVRQLAIRLYTDWDAVRNDQRRIRQSHMAVTYRRSSQSDRTFRPLEMVEDGNNQEIVDTEGDRRRQLCNDPNMLDNLDNVPAIRIDNDTNVTDSV